MCMWRLKARKKIKGRKEDSSSASRPTPIKESDKDIRFLKCFRPSQNVLCEVNVIRPVACHMQRQIPVNSRQTQ
jgi:hypothetical protein